MIILSYYELSNCQKIGYVLTCGYKKFYARPTSQQVDQVIQMKANSLIVNVNEASISKIPGETLEVTEVNDIHDRKDRIGNIVTKARQEREGQKWIN